MVLRLLLSPRALKGNGGVGGGGGETSRTSPLSGCPAPHCSGRVLGAGRCGG